MTASDPYRSAPVAETGQYGAPYGDQHPAGGYPQRTNTMAILALVFAFVFAPLGIVFGIIGKRQIRERHEDGSGLATAGLVLGSIFTALGVLWIIIVAVAVAHGVNGSTY